MLVQDEVRHSRLVCFLVLCNKFVWERQKLWKTIGDIEGSDMWLEEFMEKRKIIGSVVGMDRMAAVKIENVIMAEVLRWWASKQCMLMV